MYALPGVKINAQKVFLLHEYTQETFAPLINCVINDALLETMPDINQPLFHFIDVYELPFGKPAAAFLLEFRVNLVWI